jgi:hypothetical protein
MAQARIGLPWAVGGFPVWLCFHLRLGGRMDWDKAALFFDSPDTTQLKIKDDAGQIA